MKSSIFLMFLFLCYSISGQEIGLTSSTDQYEIKRVRWVSKFPDASQAEEKSILSRISEFFMGKKEIVKLTKPISVLAENPDLYYVLDQAVGKMIKVEGQVGYIPKIFKENHNSLVGICKTSQNDILFTESRANKIFKVNLAKNEIAVFNSSVELDQPTGIAFSPATNEIWVVETASHRISVFNQQGELLRQIGKRGNGPGEFNYPTFIWIDEYGVVYIVDSMNFRIQILDENGDVLNSFGQIGDATGYFARPKGIATDFYGNIYIVDALFHTVQIFNKNGKFLFNFGSQGRENGQFWMPSGIYIDRNNYIYIADSYNARIQVFQLIKGE